MKQNNGNVELRRRPELIVFNIRKHVMQEESPITHHTGKVMMGWRYSGSSFRPKKGTMTRNKMKCQEFVLFIDTLSVLLTAREKSLSHMFS